MYAPYRHGFTGTISNESKVHKLVLEGVFGPIRRYVTTKELMDQGTVADFKVKALVLAHSNETKAEFAKSLKELKKKNPNKKNLVYVAEREFLFSNEKRNRFISNLVGSLSNQNNLILFDWVEKHGKILEPLLRREGRVLHFIHGGVSGEERERIRHVIENDNTVMIKIHFGNQSIEVSENEEIPLTDSRTIKAKDLTENHDISNVWIKSNINTS
jgi:superfamily II DNA or RNA helicase